VGNFGVTRPTAYLEFVTNFVLSFVMLCVSQLWLMIFMRFFTFLI